MLVIHTYTKPLTLIDRVLSRIAGGIGQSCGCVRILRWSELALAPGLRYVEDVSDNLSSVVLGVLKIVVCSSEESSEFLAA